MPVVKEAFKLASISSKTWDNTAPMDVALYNKVIGTYLTAAPWADKRISISCAKTAEPHFQLVCPLVMKWMDGANQRICVLNPAGNNTFKCDGLTSWRPGNPVPIPMPFVVSPGGWNSGGGFIPQEPVEPIYGFNVRFEFDSNDKVDYLVSAPMVGHKFRATPINPPIP